MKKRLDLVVEDCCSGFYLTDIPSFLKNANKTHCQTQEGGQYFSYSAFIDCMG